MSEKVNFDATGILCTKDIIENTYFAMKIPINSIEDIKSAVYQGHDCTQLDIDMHHKVYYSLDNLEIEGINVKVHTKGREEFACFPILFVLCDDKKPIKMTKEEEQIFFNACKFL